MNSIYTKLSPLEVEVEVQKAATVGAAQADLLTKASNMPLVGDTHAGSPTAIDTSVQFIQAVNTAINKVPWSIFVKHKIGIKVEALIHHPNERLRLKTVATYG